MSFDLLGKIRVTTAGVGSALGQLGKLTAAVGGVALAYKAVDTAMSSVKKAMDFEAQLSSIKALTGATADEMARMQKLALEMGAATKYNALEAAQGIEELLKAGLTPATVEAGGLEAALNLATAGGLGLADAAEIMSTALNAYRKDGMQAAQAADILAGTANASATGVEDLRLSLAAVSAVAAGVGLTFEDTNIALGLFANSGLKGSDAGTSLKTMLQRLQPTTKEQTKLFRALGLVTADGSNAFYDSKGNIKSMQSISGTLRKSLGKLTNQQRALALETMFGTDAVRAANILFNEGADGVATFRDEMLKVTALDVAEEKMNNAAGAVEQFQGALETLQISALMPTMPLIKRFATKAADMVDRYTPEITAAMERMTAKASQYIDEHFTNNPEFQKITTLEGKIKFIYEDIMRSFNEWMDGGGRAKIAAISQDIVDFMGQTLKASQPLIDAAIEVGKSIGSGMLRGLKEFATQNPELASVLAFAATPGPLQVKLAAAGVTYGMPTFDEIGKTVTDDKLTFGEKFKELFKADGPLGFDTDSIMSASKWLGFKPDGSQAAGIDYVPYDGYISRLHKGETVLTREESKSYRESGGNPKPPVNITVQQMVVRNDSDIDKIAGQLARLLAQ